MVRLLKGRFNARFAVGAEDIEAAQVLRYKSFIEGRETAASDVREGGKDADAFDEVCEHVLVEDARTQELVCCFRLLPLNSGAEISRSYSAQYYDLSNLADYAGPMVEMGRFCIHPDYRGDADVLRVAWGAMTSFVDKHDVDLLFGCSSFEGTEADLYMDAFALLKERSDALATPCESAKRVSLCVAIKAEKAESEGCDERHAALAAHVSCDGRLGVGSCGCGSRSQHASCVHRA